MERRLVRSGTRRIMATALGVGLIAASTVSSASAQAANAPGVTKDAVKIGYLFSETGPAASTFGNAGKGCQARIDAQNEAGGVNGRKIDLVVVDDKTSANLVSAQDLVQNSDVFAVINNSPVAYLSYRYLLGEGVPLIGGGYDGTYYGQKGNEDILSALGNQAAVTGLTYDTATKIMKQLGATKSGAVAYGVSPSSSATARATQDYAAPAQGLKPVYLNTALDFGQTDVGPVVLGIKNSGADGVYLPLGSATNIAIVQGLAQNGVNMKANVLATGYGQALLDSPAANSLGANTVITQSYKPVELTKDPAVKKFRQNLKKYAKFTDVPDYGVYTGYIACDMAITGLEQAGKNLTREGFIKGLRDLGKYDAAGLACAPLDISLTNYGKTPATSCTYAMNVKDGKFVVRNGGKPIAGKLVGAKELLEANQAGTIEELATTTTAAPAS